MASRKDCPYPPEGEMKPECKLTEQNGNVFNLAGLVIIALKKAELTDERCDDCHCKFRCYTERKKRKSCYLVQEFQTRLQQCKSYDEALQLMMEYVEVG